MYQTTVGAVMTREVIAVGPDADFTTLVELLVSHDIGAVPVVSEEGVLLGVVSESDLVLKHEQLGEGDGKPPSLVLRRARQRWQKSWATRAFDLMITPVYALDVRDSLGAAAREFGRSGVRRLYVLEGRTLAGVLTRGDLLKAFVRDDEDIRREIRHEVLGRALAVADGAVDVNVDRGVVTMLGEVERRTDGELAQRLAEHVLGVVHVHNLLDYRLDGAPGLARR
ncbi:hypothetical protein DI005_04370 [Prauserella sp. PE36]|uniref:CBS domain-containing protein n=1 Tax=Prauserella sp. PE36 TaxID=1504709 RepID=UPI000DE1C2E2|nr:CBS domain-containing protein [Prauserella sp. PE36]RBM22880.1 hypothetical protein DI005_04370 [Prauserella sp. PE36]